MKTTIEGIRNSLGKDITHYSFDEMKQLFKLEEAAGGYIREIAWAPCKYGCGAKLLYGTGTHRFYKITKRTTALFCI